MVNFRVQLPDELADAVHGEASRRLLPQRQVITEFFLRFWPIYQALRLQEDFAKVWSADHDTPPWEKAVEAVKTGQAVEGASN